MSDKIIESDGKEYDRKDFRGGKPFQPHPERDLPILKTLLLSFFENLFIKDDELLKAHDFIFSNKKTDLPFSEEEDLINTILYLKDLATEINLKNIQELQAYFDKKRKDLLIWLDDFILKNKK